MLTLLASGDAATGENWSFSGSETRRVVGLRAPRTYGLSRERGFISHPIAEPHCTRGSEKKPGNLTAETNMSYSLISSAAPREKHAIACMCSCQKVWHQYQKQPKPTLFASFSPEKKGSCSHVECFYVFMVAYLTWTYGLISARDVEILI